MDFRIGEMKLHMCKTKVRNAAKFFIHSYYFVNVEFVLVTEWIV